MRIPVLLSATAFVLACAGLGPRPPAPAGMKWVATAAADIEPGTVLHAEHVTWRAVPTDYVPDSAVSGPGRVKQMRATERVLRHEYLRAERLAFDTALWDYGQWAEPPELLDREGTIMVMVFGRDLLPGAVITELDLYAVEIPPRFLPDGVFLSPGPVVGRTLCLRGLANEFVRAERLIDPGTGQCSAPGPAH